jgi:hypothetical protein
MAKHTGDWKPKYHEAMESAADQALKQSGPGTYKQVDVEIRAHHAQAGDQPGHNPLSDYRITIEGPTP